MNAKKIFLKVSRAKGFEGTSAHPLVMLEVMRWFDKEFAVEPNSILLNGLLKVSGDLYRPMCNSLIDAFDLKQRLEASEILSWVAIEIQRRIFGEFVEGAWENSTLEQLDERSKLQQEITRTPSFVFFQNHYWGILG